MTPEETLVARLRERASWLESRSFAELHGDIEREAAGVIERLVGLAQHTQQPVDWPTEPGMYWMDSDANSERVLTTFDGGGVWFDGGLLGQITAAKYRARFLPAHVPTFPPRESK